MGWEVIANLIITEGIPVAMAIWSKWSKGTPPTEADWTEIKQLSAETAQSRTIAGLGRAGIPLDDPRAKAIMDLISKE